MHRRSFIKGLGAALFTPAIVKASSLMKLSGVPIEPLVKVAYDPVTNFITIERVMEEWSREVIKATRIPERLIYQIATPKKVEYGLDYVSIPVTFKYQFPETDQVGT